MCHAQKWDLFVRLNLFDDGISNECVLSERTEG